MDADRFDALTRVFDVASRRRLLAALAAAALAHAPIGSRDEVLAKKGNNGKAKGKGKAKGHGQPHGNGKAKGQGGGTAKGGGNRGSSSAPLATSQPGACTPPDGSCDGCCQEGQCVPGTEHRSCGHSGMACQDCTAHGQSCTASRECGCDAASCDGCCTNGICQLGDRADACGSQGSACHICPEGFRCRQGTCCSDEGAAIDPAPADLPYPAACCEGSMRAGSGFCTRDCRLLGCAEGEQCQVCHQASRGFADTCLQGRCCLAAGDCPCNTSDGPCEKCCSGTCERGRCQHDCARLGCPAGSDCCPSSGECFSREQTNCRRGDGGLFQCDAEAVCCMAANGETACGISGTGGCADGFAQALPATCSEWMVRPAASLEQQTDVQGSSGWSRWLASFLG
jgi:hypothetical protein